MRLFGRGEPESSESVGAEPEPEPSEVKIVRFVEDEFEYTEHDATIRFEDGLKRVTFDEMVYGSREGTVDFIFFKNYGDELKTDRFGEFSPKKKLTFLSVRKDLVKWIETTDRRSKKLTKTWEKADYVPMETAKRLIEDGEARWPGEGE